MKKFKFIDQEREYDVSPENKIILDSIDVIIDNIVKSKDFNSLLEDLGHTNLNVKSLDSNCDGSLKDYLEKNFISIQRSNKMGMFPPLFGWFVRFDNISFKLDKEQFNYFLDKNYDFYKDKLNNLLNKHFTLKHSLYYDLTNNKFLKSI